MQPILSHVQTSVLTEKKRHYNIQNINEMSVKVTKQAMKMCHLYHRFCKTDLESTEVSISTLLDRNRNASFRQILKIHCRLQTVFRHQTFTSLVDLHRISPSHLCYLYHTMIHM